ncbi:MAG: hypothetical protein F6K09_07180 [Merismopedia sp. SIO2A8]|nr:hypothetical protein [Merismopedia sp. SIO2A8]
MLGTFQHSRLRIEVNASTERIRDSLLQSAQFKQWLWPQQFSDGLPTVLTPDTTFTVWFGPIAIQHDIDEVSDRHLRLMLSQGIDGYHEWHWGDGWLQACLEGVSVLPLNVGQTFSLYRLKRFLEADVEAPSTNQT